MNGVFFCSFSVQGKRMHEDDAEARIEGRNAKIAKDLMEDMEMG